MLSDSLKSAMSNVKSDVNAAFEAMYAIPEASLYEETGQAMRHMLLLGGGGKRIRPLLTFLSSQFFGSRADYLPMALAVEYIHTYTLIIDDIQDGDLVRRKEPTCHAKFGVNTALLTAPRLYERGLAPFHAAGGKAADITRELCDTLHRGQAGDLNAERWDTENRTEEAWRFIAGGKTSALMQLALLGGAIAAGVAEEQDMRPLMEYGYYLGLVFQGRDDVLGAVGDAAKMGKAVGADTALNKFTFFTLNGSSEERAADALGQFVQNGIKALQAYPSCNGDLLGEVIRFAALRNE